VQTFRDPSSGATFELSNQYDHAWLNGSNQYVMSDDPNFNPNGKINGNWNSLQWYDRSPEGQQVRPSGRADLRRPRRLGQRLLCLVVHHPSAVRQFTACQRRQETLLVA
jgi:hypothetical protein